MIDSKPWTWNPKENQEKYVTPPSYPSLEKYYAFYIPTANKSKVKEKILKKPKQIKHLTYRVTDNNYSGLCIRREQKKSMLKYLKC